MKTIHFVGIGGIGMSALARYLLVAGWAVSGSDRCDSDILHELEQCGAVVHVGHSADNVPINCDMVVYTSAVISDNEELLRARASGMTVILREQLLGQIFNSYRQRIAVCGTHGKTTTTAMLDYVLRTIGIRHSAFIGGMPVDSHSNCSTGGNVVVAEACEYRASFLHLFPSMTVCLNVEWDHPDYYHSITQMHDAYTSFFDNVTSDGCIIAHDSVPDICTQRHHVVRYGQGEHCQYRACQLTSKAGVYSYVLLVDGRQYNVRLSVVGRHNVHNSLAVIAVCAELGIDIDVLLPAIATFLGAERRWKVVPCDFTNVIEDYAHHPTEISAVIDSAIEIGYSNIILVFQPHTYSRTKALWRQFVSALGRADIVVTLPIYSAREQPLDGVDSTLLAHSVNCYTDATAYSALSIQEAYDLVVTHAHKSGVVLVVGAGDICQLSDMLLLDIDN